jgi:hypothetical protein
MSSSDDLVPLGEALEDVAWTREVAQARTDLEVAMGTRQEGAGPIDFIDAETLLETEYGPTPWLVDGICTEQAVMVIGGEPKTAKTWAALELAIAVATDTPFVGEFKVREANGRGAFLFLCEDNPRSVQNRLRSMIKGRGPVLAGWGQRLAVKALGSMRIDDVAALARYVATVRRAAFRPALVVFDPLRDLHQNNEDSSTEMAGVYKALRALRTVLGCAVVFVHHSGKATADGEKRRGGQKLRGSSALHGAVDAGLYLTGPSRERDEDKRKTTMSAMVESEVKAASGAGDFGLSLEVFDDANREAIRAQWVFAREAETVKADSVKNKWTARLLNCLRRHDAQKPTVPVPLRQIRSDLGISGRQGQALTDLLAELVDAGTLEAIPGVQGHAAYRVKLGDGSKPKRADPEDHWPEPDDDPDGDPWMA